MFIANLTKNWLYKQWSQEEIFEAYNVKITNSLFCSPIRKDSNPTVKLQYYNGNLLYFDNGDIVFRGVDCVKFVMLLKNLSYNEALLDIYNTLTNGNTTIKSNKETLISTKTKDKSIIKMNFKEFTKEDLDYWSAYGIDLNLLNEYNVKSISSIYIKNKEGEYFNVRKKEELCFSYLYSDGSCKIYFPNRKGLFRFITNSTIIQGLDQLKDPKYIVWTSSLKDVMCLRLFGIQGLAEHSEGICPRIPDSLKHLPQFYLADADQKGLRYASKIRNKLHIPILAFPKELYKLGCKDLSDGIKVLGEQRINELIQEAICKYNL